MITTDGRRKFLGSILLLLVTATVGTHYYYYYYYYNHHHHHHHGHPRGNGPPARRRTDVMPTVLAFERRKDDDDDFKNFGCEPVSPTKPAEEEVPTGNEVQGRWYGVDPSPDSTWFVYSAHVDRRLTDGPLVRIVAMSRGGKDVPLFCRWWGDGSSAVTRAHKQELWIRSWDSVTGKTDLHYYHPYLISCPLPRNRTPTDVSVVGGACDPHVTHRLRLPLLPPEAKNLGVVVCLKALDFVEDVGPRLLEWLELQYILGADRVYVYVRDVHRDTWKVLRRYAHSGRVVIRNHTLPVEGTTTSADRLWQKRRHEMAVYNDCFYRHVHSHAFVVNLDLDEAIVPVRHDTWIDLLREALARGSSSYRRSASLSVRNVYFLDSFGQVEDDELLPLSEAADHRRGSSRLDPNDSDALTNRRLPGTNHFRRTDPRAVLEESTSPVSGPSTVRILQKPNRSSTASLGDRKGGQNTSPTRVSEHSAGHLHMLRHVIRSANFTPAGFAQKSFFSTGFAEAVSNHYALRATRPDVRLLTGFGVEDARLHHYRKGCPPLMERECDENYERFRQRDTLLWKYRDRLVRNVLQTMREQDS